MSKKLNLILVIAVFLSALIALVPELKQKIFNKFFKNDRIILTSSRADILGNGESLLIVKIKENHEIKVEIFKSDESEVRLIQQISLLDPNDGYFNFMGEASSLAISNIDEDPQLEILVPTYTQDQVPHLNVIKFDESNKIFTLINQRQ